MKVVVPDIKVGKPGGEKEIRYNRSTGLFEVGGEEYRFEMDRPNSRLCLYRVVDGRTLRRDWIAANLKVVEGKENERYLFHEGIKGKRIRLQELGWGVNAGGLQTPKRTKLPLFLAWLKLNGATHACAKEISKVKIYEGGGYRFNEGLGIWEREL